MDQKKINIIEASIKLFAKKGFSSTSVQEIAKECNISKGAFYLQFNSKDELLYELFEYYWRRMQKRINEISSEPLTPKEKFINQLKISIDEIADYREFIIMQVREQVIPFNDMIENLIKRMRYHTILFYRNHLLAIYGKDVEPYVWEASITVQSLFKNYIDLIILDNIEFNHYDVAKSIINKMDSLISGYKNGSDQPVINEDIISMIIPEDYNLDQLEEFNRELKEIKANSSDDDLVDTAEILLMELESGNPRQAIIKGMAYNLEKHEKYLDLASRLRTHFI